MSSIAVHLSARNGGRTASPRGATRSRLRLTRRGRLLLTTLAALPLVAAALWFGLNSGMATADNHAGSSSSASFEHVTVQPGQSLWQIAEAVAPHDDPRDVISAIVDLNGLSSSVVSPGQSLAVPQQYASSK